LQRLVPGSSGSESSEYLYAIHGPSVDLFICDSCDSEGVPDFKFKSKWRKHTEEHHLIRCLYPEKEKEEPLTTEQRLERVEKRLDDLTGKLELLLSKLDKDNKVGYKV
jgi:hypothetical protein